MRIDKFLANMGVGTRNEVKQLLKKGLVNVNEQVIKSPNIYRQLKIIIQKPLLI